MNIPRVDAEADARTALEAQLRRLCEQQGLAAGVKLGVAHAASRFNFFDASGKLLFAAIKPQMFRAQADPHLAARIEPSIKRERTVAVPAESHRVAIGAY